VVLLIAEGAGRRSRRDKRRFYSMARGSAMEACAVVDILYLRQLASGDECR
jgi:four helix bundle protein